MGNFISEEYAYMCHRDPLLALRHPPIAQAASLLNGLTATAAATATSMPTQRMEILGGCVVSLSMTCAARIVADKPLQRSFKRQLAGAHASEGLGYVGMAV